MSASQSLPSFAQAFSVLPARENNALPPILRFARNDHRFRDTSRKRGRANSTASRDDDGYSSSDRASPPPRVNFIKEEQDYDQLEPSPPPHPPSVTRSKSNHTPRHEPVNIAPVSSGAPPPSLVRPPTNATNTKRRRITVSTSGAVQPSINTTNLDSATAHQTPGGPVHSHVHTGPSTPISPVVMGLSFQRDNPEALEQVRAMLSVKQKQKALIESRRGSAAGLPDGRRGSAAGLSDGKRGSIAGLQDGKRGSIASLPPVAVNIVNPTPTTLTAPTNALVPPKRSRSSPSVAAGRVSTPSGSSNNTHPANNVPSNTSASLSPHAKTGGASGPGVPPNSLAPRTMSPQSHVVPSQNPRGTAHLSPPSIHGHSHNHSRPSQSPSQNHLQPPPAVPRTNAQNQHQVSPQMHVQMKSQQQQAQLATQGLSALANALPPPPSSFGKRRAGQSGMRNNKPADIIISPRDSTGSSNGSGEGVGQSKERNEHRYSYKSLQPSIQSAPAIPRPGQQSGRFPTMTLPILPPTIPAQGATVAIRKSAVPPTPTRLTMQLNQAQGQTGSSIRLSQPTGAASGIGRSPTNPSLAVTSTLHTNAQHPMPSTPATLHSTQNTSVDKSAFLAPFEQFYDALSDARVLKGWFGEQLARVGRLAREAETQRADLEAARAEVERQRAEVEKAVATANDMRTQVERWVEEIIERELRASKDEVVWLRKRVNEVEEALWSQSRGSVDILHKPSKESSSSRPMNGIQQSPQHYPIAPGVESYTFPPVQPRVPQPTVYTAPTEMVRLSPSPRLLPADRERLREGRKVSVSRSQANSPVPVSDSGRRLSISVTRYESNKPSQRKRGSSNDTEPTSSPNVGRRLRSPRPSSVTSTSRVADVNKANDESVLTPELRRHNSDSKSNHSSEILLNGSGSSNGSNGIQKDKTDEGIQPVVTSSNSSPEEQHSRMDES